MRCVSTAARSANPPRWHATATGKALLSGLPEAEVRRLTTQHGMKAFTSHTVTDIDTLLAELAEVRATGCTMDREEFQLYVVCIGAPVLDVKGKVMASLSVSTPINRATEAHLSLVRQEVLSAARRSRFPATTRKRRTGQ